MKLPWYVFLLMKLLPCVDGTDNEMRFVLSAPGKYFQHKFSVQLLLTVMAKSLTQCATKCSHFLGCRTFDYDPSSNQCRLFEADSTTGSIQIASSPTSIVGALKITRALYATLHNQSCSACAQSKYEVCSTNTSTCQCPPRTYWNGLVCLLQLFNNDTCIQQDACRSDQNLTCSFNCYGEYQRCDRPISLTNSNGSLGVRLGITVAGGCNTSSSTNQTVLSWPSDILLAPNDTLYVGNYDGSVLAFDKNNRTGRTVASFGNWPAFMYLDNRTSELYVSVTDLHLVYVLPSNRTIPPDGQTTGACSPVRLNRPSVIITDSMKNIYISSTGCSQVMKWSYNASNGTVIAGSANGTPGNSASLLQYPYGLALDEINGFLYVADSWNNRIQRFCTNGSSLGVTVAGGSTYGPGANQLNSPREIFLSRSDNSLYIADHLNSRVQKWFLNASSGVTVAGSTNGTTGQTAFLMAGVYAIALNIDETYLYVTDENNTRIQRFQLK